MDGIKAICPTDNNETSTNYTIDYPVYFITGGGNLDKATDEELENSLSQLETIDIELCSSDDDMSLSEYDVILERETETKIGTYETYNDVFETCELQKTNEGLNQIMPFDGEKQKRYYVLSTGMRITEREIDEIIAQWRPLLRCELCMTLCPNFSLLQEHYIENHPTSYCHIVCCRRILARRTNIEEHIRVYHCDGVPRDISSKGTPVAINTAEIEAFVQHYIPKMKCGVCCLDCPSFDLLRGHFRQEHPNDEFYFSCCRRKMSRLHSVAEHIRVHLYKDSYRCQYCCKFHMTKVELELHTLEQHHTSIYTTTCHFNLTMIAKKNSAVARTTYADLDDFIAKCRKILACALCRENFSTFTALEIHFSKRHPERRAYVTCCGQFIKVRHQLEEHIHLHNNPKGFKCPTCVKYCPRRSSLYSHMCTEHPLPNPDEDHDVDEARHLHIDELKRMSKCTISCRECNEKCHNFTALKVHFRTHHPGVRWYFTCCNLQLYSPQGIAHHIRQHLQSNRTKAQIEFDESVAKWKPLLECDVCQRTRTFPYFSELEIHFAYKHPNEICHIVCCQRKLTRGGNLEEHIQLHMKYNCQYSDCNHWSTTKKDLARHVRKSHKDLHK